MLMALQPDTVAFELVPEFHGLRSFDEPAVLSAAEDGGRPRLRGLATGVGTSVTVCLPHSLLLQKMSDNKIYEIIILIISDHVKSRRLDDF